MMLRKSSLGSNCTITCSPTGVDNINTIASSLSSFFRLPSTRSMIRRLSSSRSSSSSRRSSSKKKKNKRTSVRTSIISKARSSIALRRHREEPDMASLLSLSSSSQPSSITTTDEAIDATRTHDHNHDDEDKDEDEEDKKMVQLSEMITKFVIDSAKKTRDSITDDSDKHDFIQTLRVTLRNEVLAPPVVRIKSFRDIINETKKIKMTTTTTTKPNETTTEQDEQQQEGQQQETADPNCHDDNDGKEKQEATLAVPETVINFLVQTAQGTLKSMPNEDDQYAFKHQLRTSFHNEFLSSASASSLVIK